MFTRKETIPRDKEALQAWISGVLADAGIEDNDQNRFQVAAQVQHLCQNFGPRIYRKQMIDALHQGVVNKSAFLIMQELKLKEKASSDAAQKAATDGDQTDTKTTAG